MEFPGKARRALTEPMTFGYEFAALLGSLKSPPCSLDESPGNEMVEIDTNVQGALDREVYLR